MADDLPVISLADFAATFHHVEAEAVPVWAYEGSQLPAVYDTALFDRLEEVLDTVVALQRADWLQDGVYVGPQAMGPLYRDVLACSSTLRVAVPPAIVAGVGMKGQGAFGTDSRAFLYLSSFFFGGSATPGERLFQVGRLCGHIAARQVTANTLYALVVDANGLRKVARRSLGPALEVVLAPLSLGVRLGLSRWHRAAEITADRAGLICARDVDASGLAMLRCALGMKPSMKPEDYLQQLRDTRDGSPGKWTELLADQPWMHKRLEALDLFARSQLYARTIGEEPAEDALSDDELRRRTDALLGVR